MSKIGRKQIDVTGVEISISGQEIKYKGKNGQGVYHLPQELQANLNGKKLAIVPSNISDLKEVKNLWGLHRALLANKIKGVSLGFEKKLEIVGLGFKAVPAGKKIEFNLGFSHKILFDLPESVQLVVDKTGQKLTLTAPDKEMLGAVCDRIRSFRPPEPYKGTGIKLEDEKIIRKVGKAK